MKLHHARLLAVAASISLAATSCHLFVDGASCTPGDNKTCPPGTACSEQGTCVVAVDGGVVVDTVDGGVIFDHQDGGSVIFDGGVVVDIIDGGVVADHVDGGVGFIDGGVAFIDGGVVVDTVDGGVVFGDGGVRTVNTGCGDQVLGPDELCFTTSTFTAPQKSIAVVAADFDRDGKLDIAVGQATTGDLSFLHGNGNGTFDLAGARVVTGLDQPESIAAADLDHNGAIDVFSTGESNTFNVITNGGTFASIVGQAAVGADSDDTRDVVLADFNNDGNTDFVVAGRNSGGAIGLGVGNGTFANPAGVAGGPPLPVRVVSADFNLDGKADLAWRADDVNSGPDGHITIQLGNGNGTFQNATGVGIDLPNMSNIAAGDLDGDGVPDLAAHINDGHVAISIDPGLVGGGAPVVQQIAMSNGGGDIELADMNGDGRLDMVVIADDGTTRKLVVLVNDGNLSFTEVDVALPIANETRFAIGDFNRDGRPDVVVVGFASPDVGLILSAPF
jgi:hypothetical protein